MIHLSPTCQDQEKEKYDGYWSIDMCSKPDFGVVANDLVFLLPKYRYRPKMTIWASYWFILERIPRSLLRLRKGHTNQLKEVLAFIEHFYASREHVSLLAAGPPTQCLTFALWGNKQKLVKLVFKELGQISIRKANNAAAGIRTRVTGLGSLCHNHWTTAARVSKSPVSHKKVVARRFYASW